MPSTLTSTDLNCTYFLFLLCQFQIKLFFFYTYLEVRNTSSWLVHSLLHIRDVGIRLTPFWFGRHWPQSWIFCNLPLVRFHCAATMEIKQFWFKNKQIFTLNYSYVFCFLLLVFCCCFYYTVNWDIMAVVLAGLFGASLENAKIKHAKK